MAYSLVQVGLWHYPFLPVTKILFSKCISAPLLLRPYTLCRPFVCFSITQIYEPLGKGTTPCLNNKLSFSCGFLLWCMILCNATIVASTLIIYYFSEMLKISPQKISKENNLWKKIKNLLENSGKFYILMWNLHNKIIIRHQNVELAKILITILGGWKIYNAFWITQGVECKQQVTMWVVAPFLATFIVAHGYDRCHQGGSHNKPWSAHIILYKQHFKAFSRKPTLKSNHPNTWVYLCMVQQIGHWKILDKGLPYWIKYTLLRPMGFGCTQQFT
jgi:hypothetical protein